MSVIAQAGAKGRQLHKFGGSSLADVKCYLRVAGIMAEYSQPDDMMVVSAAGSTTNQLISWLKLSQTDRLSAHQVLQTLRRYQCDLISGLLPADAADDLTSAFISDLERLAALLDGGVTDAVYAEIVGHGEIWSARLMSAVLNQQGLDAAWLDARAFLRAERAAQPQVDEGLSYPLLQQLLAQHPGKRLVVTGFISRNHDGETVLLGRNGSDYSATQIGALAGVSRVTIWSDVAGVYSADPRKVKDACLLPLLRLEAARELGLVLRYVARFDANGKARVGVEAVRPEHPLAALLPCDNVFAIESRWYRDNPLVIRGPGAGRDVTAGAIQSDINRLAQLL